jgi:hypothetical protein
LGTNEFLGFSKELRSEDTDGSGSVSDFIVLDFGDVDEDLGSGIVE